MVAKSEPIISRDPEVVSGELVFAGTRVPVKNLVDYFVAGHYSLDDFPSVGREQAVAYLEMSMEAADELRAREREASPDACTAR